MSVTVDAAPLAERAAYAKTLINDFVTQLFNPGAATTIDSARTHGNGNIVANV